MIEDIKDYPPLGKSDHVGIGWNFMIETNILMKNKTKLDYWKGNYEGLQLYLENIDWVKEMHGVDINEAWRRFKIYYEDGIRQLIPCRKIKTDTKSIKKLPKDMILHVKERNSLWKRYQITKRDTDWDNYRIQRNYVKSRIRVWESEMEKSRILGFKGDKKKFYKYIKSKQVVKSNINFVKNGINELTTTEIDTAEILNMFFQSVFIDEGNYDEGNYQESEKILSCIDFKELDVLNKIDRLKEEKAQGPDEVSPKVLKECKEQMCKILTILFRKSLEEGKLPEDWKSANIIPIHKGGDKTEPSNYRPISLTSIPCKLMESIIIDKVKLHLKDLDIPNKHQHGFTQGRSCLTNLLTTLEEWTMAIDDGYAVDVIYLDISKAFDSVPHKRLIEKMKWYGLQGKVLKWLSDFLTDRKMRVCVNNKYSEWCLVNSSVPQGSVVGPTQFSMFINDMSCNILSRIIQFADDTKLWRVIKTIEDQIILQEDLNKLTEWSKKWLLKFNLDKCKILHIGKNPRYDYYMGDDDHITLLTETALEKDLGVMISQDLKVGEQCNRAAKKAMRVLGMVKRSFTNLDIETLRAIYCGYIRPHLEYCIQAWSPYLKKDIAVLEKIQRRATKLAPCLKEKKYEERLKILKLELLEQRRLRGDLIETFKILENKEDLDAKIFFSLADTKHLRGNSKKLVKMRTRLKLRQNFFSQRVIRYWNDLPNEVIEATSVNSFKNRLDNLWSGKTWEDIKAQGRCLS